MTATPIEQGNTCWRNCDTCRPAKSTDPTLRRSKCVRGRPTNPIDTSCRSASKSCATNCPTTCISSSTAWNLSQRVIDTLKLAPRSRQSGVFYERESRQENQRKLGNAYPIGQPSDPAKKINFTPRPASRGATSSTPTALHSSSATDERRTRCWIFQRSLRRYADASEIPVTRRKSCIRLFHDQIQQGRNARRIRCGYPADACRRRKLCRRDKLVE